MEGRDEKGGCGLAGWLGRTRAGNQRSLVRLGELWQRGVRWWIWFGERVQKGAHVFGVGKGDGGASIKRHQ